MSASDRPIRASAAIVGAADIVSPTGKLGRGTRELELTAIRDALLDAGLRPGDVDGLALTGGISAPLDVAEYLGIEPRYVDTTMSGGCSFETHVEHAATAIANGQAETVVVVYAGAPRSGGMVPGAGGSGKSREVSPYREWEAPYGAVMPIGGYALAASRHLAQYGTTSEQLAQIAVSTRQWAMKNPRAKRQESLTIEQVLASPMVCDPLHLADCCLVTDGAGAIVLTSAERAAHLAKDPVYVLGAASAHSHSMISEMPDLTVTPGAQSGPRAFELAGIAPGDVDVLESYDSFTITVLLALEDLGFCPKGEGGAFVMDGALGPGGRLPTNTNGGGLSYTHPGMYGIFLLVEAVRQLRGEGGDRQVDGAEIAVAHGCGGVLSATSTVVLGTEATR